MISFELCIYLLLLIKVKIIKKNNTEIARRLI